MDYENTPEDARKYHYWRGFKASLIAVAIVLVPVSIALAVYLNHVLTALK